MSISKAVSCFIKQKNLTKYRVAKNASMAETTLGEIANGKNNNPRLDTLEKVARGLGVTLSDLIKKAEEF